ncbi:Fis family transcriptional regulator [Hydrogenimonas urashimensis]|uniref:Fis family transcriptional regulator n=1 Tax=Hydrogenimonas urashimensis TaxID=2740515 RepID=UPI001916A021|nr:Fis family transcriptional regulator [Hydrogenimonas urashimensis]
MKSANLLKSLKLNTLISGEPGTGRHTLARLIMPDAVLLHGDDPDLFQRIEKNPQLIIDRFEAVEHYPKLFQSLRKHGGHIVAIADGGMEDSIGASFSVRIVLPPLKERPEDIPPLLEKFRSEMAQFFGEKGMESFEIDRERLDVSQNAFSLRKSIMLQYIASRIQEQELMDMTEKFLSKHMESQEEIYRKMLYLYEVPLIRAGFKRYKSQLKMSQVFGLNRNTLRKKINEWQFFLK